MKSVRLIEEAQEHLEQVKAHLKSEGYTATDSAAVRYALFRVATSLPPPKQKPGAASAAE